MGTKNELINMRDEATAQLLKNIEAERAIGVRHVLASVSVVYSTAVLFWKKLASGITIRFSTCLVRRPT